MDADELIEKVKTWSEHDERVVAAGICGSHARGEAEPGSDIDFCILSADPGALLADRAWAFELSEYARVADGVEDYKLVQSIRVFYEATEAEFGVTTVAWATPPIDRETAAVINSGLRVLYDPAGHLERAIAAATMTDG